MTGDITLPEGDAQDVGDCAARHRLLAEQLATANGDLAQWSEGTWGGTAGSVALAWVLALRMRIEFERDRCHGIAAALGRFAAELSVVESHRARTRELMSQAEAAQRRAAATAASPQAGAYAAHYLSDVDGMWDGQAVRLRAQAARSAALAREEHAAAATALRHRLEPWAGPAPVPPPPPVPLQLTFDAVGFVPIAGDGLDGMLAATAFAEGRTEEGWQILASAAPVFGTGANASRLARTATKIGGDAASRQALDTITARVSREGSRQKHVRMMETDTELRQLFFDEILPLGRRSDVENRPGQVRVHFDDGTVVTYRPSSASGGAALQIKAVGMSFNKVHTRSGT